MSRTLICGSIAFDNIMVFQGRFKEHILPAQIHILNVAFLVPQLRRGRDGMRQPAEQLAKANVPFICDPGQGLPMFNGEELLAFIDKATYVAVNDYEGKLLEERTGKSLAELAKSVKALVQTRGGEGSS